MIATADGSGAGRAGADARRCDPASSRCGFLVEPLLAGHVPRPVSRTRTASRRLGDCQHPRLAPVTGGARLYAARRSL